VAIENKVSEHPSESCSIMDESENIVGVEGTGSKHSSESKSDKENSNIRSN
jgi:hypothetical protein